MPYLALTMDMNDMNDRSKQYTQGQYCLQLQVLLDHIPEGRGLTVKTIGEKGRKRNDKFFNGMKF